MDMAAPVDAPGPGEGAEICIGTIEQNKKGFVAKHL